MRTEPELMMAFTAAQQLSAITRYSKDSLVTKESVLEHTGWVCFFAYTTARRLERMLSPDIAQINWAELYKKSVIHDLDEILTGDVPRVTKYSSPEMAEQFKKLERSSVKRLAAMLQLDERQLFHDWDFAKDDSIEGLIVSIADVLAVVYKCWQEVELFGNASIVRVVVELLEGVLPKVVGRLNSPGLLALGPTYGPARTYLLGVLQAATTIVERLERICADRLSDSARRSLIQFNTGG
jgi:5'-deoxynucleotidase YfbR-like HD superfamily hydrolase